MANRIGGVVGVVAILFAGGEHMQRMVDVVVPLRRVPPLSRIAQIARLVGVVFQNQMHMTPGINPGAHAVGQLDQNMRAGIIQDRMHRIQAQAVEVVLMQPVERVMDEKLAHLATAAAIEIDRRAPGCVVPFGEERAGVEVEIIPLRPEVVIDHIQQDHQAARVRRLHQGFEVIGAPVAAVGGVGQDTVVSPVARARKIRHGHEFDGGDA